MKKMKEYFTTSIGRLRIAAILEGVSLLVLIGIGVPLKHFMDIPQVVRFMGPMHGALFLLFVFLMVGVATEYGWKDKTIFKVVLACFVPFGTFYIDRKFLSKVHRQEQTCTQTNTK